MFHRLHHQAQFCYMINIFLLSFSSVISLIQCITLFGGNNPKFDLETIHKWESMWAKGSELVLNPRGWEELQKFSSFWHCPPDTALQTHSHSIKTWTHIPVLGNICTDIVCIFVNVINNNKSTCHFNEHFPDYQGRWSWCYLYLLFISFFLVWNTFIYSWSFFLFFSLSF